MSDSKNSPKLANLKDMTPNVRLVERLRELLEEAEKGELRHLVYVGAYENTAVNSSWVTDYRAQYLAGRSMLGEMAMLSTDFQGMLMRTEPDRWLLPQWIEGEEL